MPTGYCTVDDVRRALREKDLPGDAAQDRNIVIDAIVSQTEWVRATTDSHWYESGGLQEDTDDIIPSAPRSRTDEEHDIPSTPHPQHSQLFVHDRGRYPYQTNGPYTRIPLAKEHVSEITTLKIRDASGEYLDWVGDATKTEGDDYALYVAAGDVSSASYVDLKASSLPVLNHYDSAVRVSYDYGRDDLPRTVRRAVALKAGANLLLDDDAALAIPENASFVTAESKVQAMERQAEELLGIH